MSGKPVPQKINWAERIRFATNPNTFKIIIPVLKSVLVNIISPCVGENRYLKEIKNWTEWIRFATNPNTYEKKLINPRSQKLSTENPGSYGSEIRYRYLRGCA